MTTDFVCGRAKARYCLIELCYKTTGTYLTSRLDMLQRSYLRNGNCYVTELTLGESPNIHIPTRYFIVYILYILGIRTLKIK